VWKSWGYCGRGLSFSAGGGRDAAHERVIYTSEYTGWEKAVHRAQELWLDIVGIFLKI